jgi:hypothetical protein
LHPNRRIGGLANSPPQRERVFTLNGLILLCMFSYFEIIDKDGNQCGTVKRLAEGYANA